MDAKKELWYILPEYNIELWLCCNLSNIKIELVCDCLLKYDNDLAVVAFYFCIVDAVSSSSSSIFFHEPSCVSIHPQVQKNYSDFGFAMGFQAFRNKLVIGAPSADLEGKVYTCDMEHAAVVKDISCQETVINIKSRARHPPGKQHFYLGSSIAVTSDYFLTCAPLWTYMKRTDLGNYPDAVGTCFIVYNDNKIQRYSGTYEQYRTRQRNGWPTKINRTSFIGGTGWTTVVDNDNGLLLIVKPTLQGDIIYTKLTEPQKNTESMILTKALKEIEKFFNFGFGFTSGKFFSNETVYAFSAYTKRMEGIIDFLKYNPQTNKFSMMNQNIKSEIYTIHSKTVAAMFGSTLTSANLDLDEYTDLLAGAPVYSAEECAECGAVYIYTGGEMKSIGERNKLLIIGVSEFGRFGTAILTKDLDGDGKPEIVISAPYEDEGAGAVYILFGYEIYEKLLLPDQVQLMISELKHVQRIQKKSLRHLGHSLQFISDADENGCDELVAGSPGSDTAVLFKCVQVINVTLSYGDMQTVREQDTNFDVEVCVNVEYPKNLTDISANLALTYSVLGEAIQLPKTNTVVNISCQGCPVKKSFCENVTVTLLTVESGEYKFNSYLELQTGHILESPEFKRSWVVASAHSEWYKSKRISRHCTGDDCEPQLSMDILWSRSDVEKYVLGSSSHENATIQIRNDGNSSYEACVFVQVKGASLSQDTMLVYCTNYNNGYSCQLLPKPFKRFTERLVKLVFDMTAPSNEHTHLLVKAVLYEKCYTESTVRDMVNLNINYIMPTHDIFVAGSNHTKIITDKQIMSDNHMETDLDTQEFLITNNGSIKWKKVITKITMEKKPYTHKLKVSTIYETACKESHTDYEFICTCTLNLHPNSTYKIVATTEILKWGIETYMLDNKLNMTSEIELYLQPTEKIIKQTAKSTIIFQRELTIANNKWFLGIIVVGIALLILIIIFTVLYRRGFFKRKQKKRLQVLRESFKQRESRRNTHVSSVADEQGLEDVDVDDEDDSAFENIEDFSTPLRHQPNRLSKIEEKGE